MRKPGGRFLLGVIMIVLLIGGAVFFWQRESRETVTLTMGDQQLTFLMADTAPERYQGLSGKTVEDLQGVDGMAFLFSEPAVQTFSMREMQFGLDFVWILQGEVVKVDADIQAPTRGEKPRIIASGPKTADLVLELPAGRAEELGIWPGMRIEVKR